MPRFKHLVFFLLVVAVYILMLPGTASALSLDIKPPNPVIKIPGMSDFTKPSIDQDPRSCPEINEIKAAGCLHIPWIGQYLANLYRFAVLASTILATVVIMIAGFMWLTAGGNVNQIGTAKSYIAGAIMGAVLMLGSYTILNLINPKLISFNALRVAVVEKKELEQVKTLEAAKYESCRWLDPQTQLEQPSCQGLQGDVDTSGQRCGLENRTSPDQTCCCFPVPLDLATKNDQKANATPELAKLISCIQSKQAITITSISDDNLFSGSCQPWDSNEIFNPQAGYKQNCQHHRGSKHYGRLNTAGPFTPNSEFSCAVDLATPIGGCSALQDTVLRFCGQQFNLRPDDEVLCEGGHLHVELRTCG